MNEDQVEQLLALLASISESLRMLVDAVETAAALDEEQ